MDTALINKIFVILVAAPPVILAITLHEVAHGRAALWCGDSTAKAFGRLTLNPIKHMDPIGTVAVPLGLLLLSSLSGGMVPIFGWAKPVPVNIGNLRNPLRDQFWVAGAGPFSNLLMALLWFVVFKLMGQPTTLIAGIFSQMAFYGVLANVGLMLLNLLPILPLDGGRILQSLLPRHLAYSFGQTERYGFMILLFLLFSKVLNVIFQPAYSFVFDLLR